MSDVLSPDALSRIDTFYDTTLKSKLEAIETPRRQVRWLIIKSLLVVLPPIAILIAGDLIDDLMPFSSTVPMVIAWIWLPAGVVFVLVRYLLPGLAAYATYRNRFKQDIVAEIFKLVCPTATYDPLQGITQQVFDTPGLFNTRGAFHCDDRVRGRLGHVPFEVSEVSRAYTTGSGKNARSYSVFNGLFFHVDSHHQLNGTIVIDPTRAQSHQLGERDGLGMVTFDDQAFAKEFTVYAADETEARRLLTAGMTQGLLALRHQVDKPVFLAFKGRRAYLALHYGRTLFEPGIARGVSKADLREIAEHFALVETIVRELHLNMPPSSTSPDDSLLHGPDADPNPVSRLAATKDGAVTTADLFDLASASIDESAKDGDELILEPDNTRILLEPAPGGLSIHYGLGAGFWVMLTMSLGGALLAASALRAPDAPSWAAPASAWVRTQPSLPWLDRFAADAPTPWLIVGTVVALLFALFWTGYVRRVVVEIDRILIYRGLRPIPRVYRRPEYGRVIRINGSLYIAKPGSLRVMNPTASPLLDESEAKWVASEMKRALR